MFGGKVEIDGVVGCRTDARRNAGKQRRDRAMDVAGADQPYVRMTLDDRGQLRRVTQVLAIHMGNAGLERRMMQEDQSRPAASGIKLVIEPSQRLGLEGAKIAARHRGI